LAVYTSRQFSLAVLEMLVHMEPRHFGDRFVYFPLDIPDGAAMDHLDVDSLPDDWTERYEDETLQQVGREWIAAANSAMLVVPSAVVPQEQNIILNPEHRDFAAIKIGQAQPFRCDGRLKP
jgi:RES domain-containing protein